MKPPPVNAERDTAREEPEPTIDVDIVIEAGAWQDLPDAENIARRAVAAAASAPRLDIRHAQVSILLCDDAAIAALNGRWRGQEKPTNVLSFPAHPPPPYPPQAGEGREGGMLQEKLPLGDIAIACETLVREARDSGKTASAHLSHLVVHGFLHLAGYGHETDDEAEDMEDLEREILARIGVADPYAACDADI